MRISDWSSDVCSSDLRCRQRAADARGDAIGLVGGFVDRHQDAEFVAADPRQRVAHAQRALDPARDGDQQFVARQRAQARVDAAEPVEIDRSEEHTSELQSLMRISYAVFRLTKKKNT